MLSRVLARTIIVTTYMPALGTTSQVQPPSAACQALDTAIPARFHIGVDTANVLLPLLHRARSSQVWLCQVYGFCGDALATCHRR